MGKPADDVMDVLEVELDPRVSRILLLLVKA